MTTATFANGTSTSFGPTFAQNPYTTPFMSQGSPFGSVTSPFVGNASNLGAGNCCLIWDCYGCCYVCSPNGQCCPVSGCSPTQGLVGSPVNTFGSPFGSTYSSPFGSFGSPLGSSFGSPFGTLGYNTGINSGLGINQGIHSGLGINPWNSGVTPWNCGISPWACGIPSGLSNPYNCSPYNCSPFNCSPFNSFPSSTIPSFGVPSFGVPFGYAMPYNCGPNGFPQGVVPQNPGDQQLRNNG